MSDTTTIRVVIADDHALVREGLRSLLETERDIAVVGEAADGLDAIARAQALKPDVLLLDLAMPRMSGLEVLRALAESGSHLKVVLLTAAIEQEETVQALKYGVRGVLLKDAPTPLLFKCVRTVAGGGFWVGHERIADLMQTLRQIERPPAGEGRPASRLTARELQVIAAIVDGETNKDIGRRCGLSEQTVKNHLSNIFDKLGVSTRLELALYAVHHRLLAGVTPDAPSGQKQAPRPGAGTARPRR